MTPIVKLVFGIDHDKTRLAEYAAVLRYAEANDLASGTLAKHIATFSGGLKGVVQTARGRGANGTATPRRVSKSLGKVAAHLRSVPARASVKLDIGEEEFVLLIGRRGSGAANCEIIGQIADPAQRDRILRALAV